MEAPAPRPVAQSAAEPRLERRREPSDRGAPSRSQLWFQGLPPRGRGGARRLRRVPPVHPPVSPRQGLSGRRGRGPSPRKAAWREQVWIPPLRPRPDRPEIAKTLLGAEKFQKIIVNAFDYRDIVIFTLGLMLAEEQGKNFLFRTAASFVKVRGGIKDKKLLAKDELVKNNNRGGLIIVGSHVEKTTNQLYAAMELEYLKTVELSVPKVISGEMQNEISRVSAIAENEIASGNTVLVYTSRNLVKVSQKISEENLEVSAKISSALVNVVKSLNTAPSFIIAKGGITSSDIGTKGLEVKRALVAGQIRPGIPVWITDENSKFPEIPYVIFPGNVGNNHTLKEIIAELTT